MENCVFIWSWLFLKVKFHTDKKLIFMHSRFTLFGSIVTPQLGNSSSMSSSKSAFDFTFVAIKNQNSYNVQHQSFTMKIEIVNWQVMMLIMYPLARFLDLYVKGINSRVKKIPLKDRTVKVTTRKDLKKITKNQCWSSRKV